MTVTPLFREASPSLPGDGLSLGPGTVVAVSPAGLTVELPGRGQVKARLAVAFPYEPRVGDDVLVIGRADGAHWVIGVERSTGPASLTVHGDLEVKAVGGMLTLSADRGVAVGAPDVEIRTQKLRVFAESVLEHATSMAVRVRELYTLFAGQSNSVVEGTHVMQAKRAKVVTEETVSINGREIHLG